MSRSPYPIDPQQERDRARRPTTTRLDSRATPESRPLERADSSAGDPRSASRSVRHERVPESVDWPRAHYTRDRTYFLRDSELQTLAEVGTFRVIAAFDLARLRYGENAARMERELRSLKQTSLLSEKPGPGEPHQPSRLVALTKRGSRIVRKSGRVADEQAIYHGFRKPREAKHDADLYCLYQVEVARIEAAGGRPTRVVLDYELKRNLNRDLERLGREGRSPEALEQIAERNGLRVVDGKIPVPDLRIEYNTAEMEPKHLDLELATRNYRPRALAEKAKAGFRLYARSEDASRLRRALDAREITAVISSL
jgi:hypothetical protein